jgi:transcriptional regulator with XRE-family HTH domain
MKPINSRITALRKYLGFNQTQFAKELGVTSAAISAIELGKANIPETNIRLICFTFKVNEVWLRDGVGEMMDDEAALTEYEKRLLAVFRELSPLARKMLIEYADKLISDEEALRGGVPEAPEQPPQSATKPLEAPQGERRADTSKKPV